MFQTWAHHHGGGMSQGGKQTSNSAYTECPRQPHHHAEDILRPRRWSTSFWSHVWIGHTHQSVSLGKAGALEAQPPGFDNKKSSDLLTRQTPECTWWGELFKKLRCRPKWWSCETRLVRGKKPNNNRSNKQQQWWLHKVINRNNKLIFPVAKHALEINCVLPWPYCFVV